MHILRQLLLASSTLVSCAVLTVSAADIYVATNGNDGWSGTLAAPNAGRTDGPFATLEKARDEVRKRKKAGAANEPCTVHIREGLHSLSKTLQLDAQDSGSAAAPVIWRAYGKEKPILIGGKAITGWKTWKGEILQADVGAQGFKGIYFRQLIFDGQRQHLARYPNYDAQNRYGGGWAYADGKPVPMYGEVAGENKRTLHFKASDARPWGPGVTNAEVFVFPRFNWWNNIERVASLDRNSMVITLRRDCSYPIRPGDRYYVRNLLEELDAPGEWFLNKQNLLYFYPPSPLAGKAVYAPTLRTILDLGPGTAHVTFRGLIFECAEGTAIQLTKTTNCVIAGCTVRNVGDYNGSGVTITGGFRNGVEGCDILETGSHGIHLGGGDQKKLIAAENYADNNYLHHFGVFYKQGVGVSMSGCGNRASHNLIHDGPRMGIIFGGNNHLIELNEIHHVNLETEDTGAVYTGGRDWLGSRGTVIRHNYFHDILGYGKDAEGNWRSPHFAWGVYLDDNTGGVDVIGNIVVRAHRAGIHLHNGRDNHIFNNIFVGSAEQQMECNGWTEKSRMWLDHLPTMIKGYESVINEPAWQHMRHMELHPTNAPLSDGKIMASNVFLRNIVAWNDPKAKYVSFRTFPFDYNRCDSNVIWHAGQPILTGQTRVGRDITANLLANGGFEESEPGKLPKGWWWQSHPANAQAIATTDTAAGGKQSFRIDGAQTMDTKGNKQQPSLGGARVRAKPGAHYRLTAKLKASKADAKVSLAGQSHIPNVYFWSKDSSLSVGTEWKSYEVTFKFPAPGDSNWKPQMTNVEVAVQFKEPNGALFVDDLSLTETEALNEWDSWKALGMDQHSIVADPLFVNAEKDDYRLATNSPAFRLGFEPIPIEKIGPYSSELRASWPVK